VLIFGLFFVVKKTMTLNGVILLFPTAQKTAIKKPQWWDM
jgi:hypothetical protein